MRLILDYQKLEIASGITIEAKSLEYADYQHLARFTMSLVEASKSDEPKEVLGLKQLSNEDLMEVGRSVIPKYCRNLKGIEVEQEGTERLATIEDLTTYGAFSPIIIAVLTKLFEISTIKEKEDLKKQ